MDKMKNHSLAVELERMRLKQQEDAQRDMEKSSLPTEEDQKKQPRRVLDKVDDIFTRLREMSRPVSSKNPEQDQDERRISESE